MREAMKSNFNNMIKIHIRTS